MGELMFIRWCSPDGAGFDALAAGFASGFLAIGFFTAGFLATGFLATGFFGAGMVMPGMWPACWALAMLAVASANDATALFR